MILRYHNFSLTSSLLFISILQLEIRLRQYLSVLRHAIFLLEAGNFLLNNLDSFLDRNHVALRCKCAEIRASKVLRELFSDRVEVNISRQGESARLRFEDVDPLIQ